MDFSELDSFMELLPQRGIPGADLAVTKDRETVYRRCAGFADAEKTKPVSERDIYWIFSATKVTTCTVAMRLVEQGLIGLDDPVSKYLPEFADVTVKGTDGTVSAAKNVMTVRHLFSMTAGLDYNLRSDEIVRVTQDPNASTRDIVAAMAKTPLSFEPGENYKYSLCHDVLAAIVEVVSGMRFSEYIEKYVTTPLGMPDTGFRLPSDKAGRMSAMYRFDSGSHRSIPMECRNEFMISNCYDSGGAGFYSTVNDQIKLLTVLANGGSTSDGYSLLKPETIAMMQKNELSEKARKSFGVTRLYGYGWGLCGRVHVDPLVSFSLSPVGEFGWDGAAGAFSMVDPKNHIALYFGMQVRSCQYAYHILHPMIRNLVYKALS